MSCVAVRKYDDRIIMTSDSIIGIDNEFNGCGCEKALTPGCEYKLVKFKTTSGHSVMIGCVGLYDEMQMFVEFTKKHIDALYENDDIRKIDILKLVKSVKEEMKEYTDVILAPSDSTQNCDYIIALDTDRGLKCFAINFRAVFEIQDYFAIGAGKQFALGALSVGATTVQAVESACKYSIYCSAPIKTEILTRSNKED